VPLETEGPLRQEVGRRLHTLHELVNRPDDGARIQWI
jgi:hypothetical protein